jgi:hypothetical protein
MDNSPSSFRMLVKSYINHVISREEYVKIRSQMLKQLQSNGSTKEPIVKNFSLISQFTNANPLTQESYSASDWIIIILGLIASVVLGLIVYG